MKELKCRQFYKSNEVARGMFQDLDFLLFPTQFHTAIQSRKENGFGMKKKQNKTEENLTSECHDLAIQHLCTVHSQKSQL